MEQELEGVIRGKTGDDPEGALPAGLRGRAVRASAWALSGHPVGFALRCGKSLVLTRLLFPEAFGLMALVNVAMNGLAMVSDVGVDVNIIQNPKGQDAAFLRTAWTIQILRGFALWIVCCLAAWPIAAFYGEPELRWLLPAAGFNLVIGGFVATNMACLRRKLEIGRVTVFSYSMMVIDLILLVPIAYVMRSVWALVIGSLASSLIYAVSTHVLLPGIRHRLAWNRQVASSLIHFGKWVLVSSLMTFLARQADKMLLGKLIDMETLGVYSIALVLAMLPREVMTGLSRDVLLPAVAETARTGPDALEARILRARSLLLQVSALGVAGVTILGPWFFRTFYDPRWWPAGEMAMILAVPTWFGVLQVTSGFVLLALGDSRALTFVNGATFLALCGTAYVGNLLLGLPGFILGTGIATSLGEVVTWRFLARRGVGLARQDLAYSGLVAFLCLAGVGAIRGARLAAPALPVWAVESGVAAVLLVPITVMLGRRFWKEVCRR